MHKRSRILGGLVVLSIIAVSCTKKDSDDATAASSATPAAATDHTADALAITQGDSAWLRGVMNKNVDSVMAFYTPDAVSYGFGVAPSSGTDQIRAEYTEMVKSTITNPRLSANTVKFSDDGSLAYDYGTYQMTVQPPGGKADNVSGAFLNVWRKVDGQWKLAAEMSTPVPAPKS
ncbi:MAG: nuclear transport factor 2 family protein [Gemmatimonadaceae bacterium]